MRRTVARAHGRTRAREAAEISALVVIPRGVHAPRDRRPSGFSLIEMLVVLTLLAVMAAVVAPALVSLDAPAPATPSDEVVRLFTDARRTAVTEAREVELHLDFKSGHYRIDEGDRPSIAGTLRAAGSLRSGTGGEVGTWRFTTDGRVEGPDLFVTSGKPRTIRFDPGTGELLP